MCFAPGATTSMSTHDHLPKRDTNPDLSTLKGIDARGTVPHPHENRQRRNRNMLIGGGTVASFVAAGLLYLGISGNDDDPKRADKVQAGTSQTAEPTAEPTPDVVPTPDAEPCDASWCEVLTREEVISIEDHPTLEKQIARGWELVTAAANDPGPHSEGFPYKRAEALFGGYHYDTDMEEDYEWLQKLSQDIGFLNSDFEAYGYNQPKFVDNFEFVRIVEKKGKDTAIVELLETTNAPDFDPAYRNKIRDYLGKSFDLSGKETTYWEVSMRQEEGRAVFSNMTTLRDYVPPEN